MNQPKPNQPPPFQHSHQTQKYNKTTKPKFLKITAITCFAFFIIACGLLWNHSTQNDILDHKTELNEHLRNHRTNNFLLTLISL